MNNEENKPPEQPDIPEPENPGDGVAASAPAEPIIPVPENPSEPLEKGLE